MALLDGRNFPQAPDRAFWGCLSPSRGEWVFVPPWHTWHLEENG